MSENAIRIISFMSEIEKWRMWSGKVIQGYGIKVYNVLLTGANKITADKVDETIEKIVSELKLLNKTAYSKLILSQEETVCFHIFEEAKTKANRYGDTRQTWMKLSRNFDPSTGAFETGVLNKFTKCKLYDVTRNPKEWITELKLLRGDLGKLDVNLDDS